ncbi:zinc ribbon domain-containing protein [Streptomyces phaeochromogenes]
MARLMATAACTAFGAVVEAGGERIGPAALFARVSHLASLCGELTGALVAARWDEASLDVLAAGLDEQGQKLPSKGWMALRRLGWTRPPGTAVAAGGGGLRSGVYVSDRVRRAAEEYAARALRLALHRRSILTAILATWPADAMRRSAGEWTALRAALPSGVTVAEIRNRTRQVRAFVAGHGRLPVGLCELEDPPHVAPQILLAAMDRQQVTLDRVDAATARLRVKLPLCAAPASGRDWAWHVLDIRLPAPVGPDAVLHAPTLRPTRSGRIAVDLPHSAPAPALQTTGHTVAVGFDWGVNTLLTGVLGRLTPVGGDGMVRVVTDGRPLTFDATVISAKLHRLRGHRERLAAKRDHYQALADGLGSPNPHWGHLLDRATVLEVEHARVCARIRALNHALAWAAARWAVNQATALGARVIYLEDLATLEARGRRAGNARLSGQVRGTVAEAIRHLAARAGIAVVTVPARGTSKLCPGCLHPLTHHPAPDRLAERGWKWAHCARCGLSLDRDQAAARRIAARGLLAQHHTRTDRTTGIRAIRTTVEGPVGVVRRPKKTTRRLRRTRQAATAPPRPRGPRITPGKGHATPTRPRHTTTARAEEASRRMPEARTVPATTRPRAVQRPAGHDIPTLDPYGPVPDHGPTTPTPPGVHPPRRWARRSRGTCRRRTRAAERTGFHQLHATHVHPLPARFGPPAGERRRPRRTRKA